MDLALGVRVLSERRAVLSVKGRLDAANAPALRARIQELIGEGRVELVCDLTDVSFLDSSGLAALVSDLKIVRKRGGFLKLAGLDQKFARVFTRTMLDRVFVLHPSVEAALAMKPG